MQLSRLNNWVAVASLSCAALYTTSVSGSPQPQKRPKPYDRPNGAQLHSRQSKHQAPDAGATREALHTREYFYVGGEYVAGSTGHFWHNQMYVEKLTAPTSGAKKQPYPLVLVHGGGQSGTNFLNKPDGSRGWASYFLGKGYDVYIVDRTLTARSPVLPLDALSSTAFSAEFISQRFTAVQNYPKWPQAKLHTQWPGSGEMGDAIFDAYYASNVQNVADALAQEKSMAAAGVALLERIGPAVVVTHSQAGLYGWKWADERPQLVMALVQIEPKGPPFEEAIFSNDFSRAYGLTSVPLTFSPVLTEGTNASLPLPYEKVAPPDGSGLLPCLVQREPARKLPQLAKVPMVVVSSEASYHAQYDYCFIKFLKQAGVMADHLELGKEGIHGNAHLMFMEKNSDEVAGAVHKWISKTIGVR